MMKKFLLIETTLLSAFIAVLMTCASLSKSYDDSFSAVNDMQTSAQNAMSSQNIHNLGDFYPEP
jgi:hypothetical protein